MLDAVDLIPGDDNNNSSDLPERSFAHAGTNVNTVTLRIQKPRN